MRYRLTLIATIIVSLFSCSEKTTEIFETELLTEYYPLEPGKYITYRLDSLVLTDFGKAIETHSYQVKHLVDTVIEDNLGRPSYRIYRYIRNADGTGEWANNGAYFVTPLQTEVEVVEDNLRFIKLHAPLKEGNSWKGNNYLHVNPYPSYNFTLFGYMRDWEYIYDSFSPSFDFEGQQYTDVWTVEEKDQSENYPVTEPARPGGKIRAVEKYAKNIGLVFREYTILEYEPNTTAPDPYYRGFGITMWMIDHN